MKNNVLKFEDGRLASYNTMYPNLELIEATYEEGLFERIWFHIGGLDDITINGSSVKIAKCIIDNDGAETDYHKDEFYVIDIDGHMYANENLIEHEELQKEVEQMTLLLEVEKVKLDNKMQTCYLADDDDDCIAMVVVDDEIHIYEILN